MCRIPECQGRESPSEQMTLGISQSYLVVLVGLSFGLETSGTQAEGGASSFSGAGRSGFAFSQCS